MFSKFSHMVVSRVVILVMFLLSVGLSFGFFSVLTSEVKSMIESGDFKNHVFVVYIFATLAVTSFGLAIGAVTGFLFPLIYKKATRIYGLLSVVAGGVVGFSLFNYLLVGGYPHLSFIGLNAMLYLIGGGIILMASWEENWLIKASA